ncbi:hypothetical protein TSUD_213340 [Trifolium subterraneum]|uniref:Uncharacterized protein n=1 Tax=Trifolium subterraneum TaxID=3900 RepID=A0A2Z6P331_TRISU|nr:hypothetical protein TSUD_213340 [Trifolium subterraneum]
MCSAAQLFRQRYSAPPPQQQQQAQPSQSNGFGDDTNKEHRAQMESFCWMQDVCGSLRIPATYLTHQMDRLAAAQHFRERNYGPPPKPIKNWFMNWFTKLVIPKTLVNVKGGTLISYEGFRHIRLLI